MTRNCPICFLPIGGDTYDQRSTAVDKHVRAEHPSFEVRIVNEQGDSMSSVGYFPGAAPDWLKTADGKSLDKVKTTSTSEVAKRLKLRVAEHESKARRAVTESGKAAHAADKLFVKVIEG